MKSRDITKYHQETLHNSPGTRCRKIVSIRQFWECLKFKAHIIDNNIAEELETPKLPMRIVRSMTLEESVRLLIEASSSSVRDNCIITIFLNCALRLSELVALNIEQTTEIYTHVDDNQLHAAVNANPLAIMFN